MTGLFSHIYICIYGECHNPNWRTLISFRGVLSTTNQINNGDFTITLWNHRETYVNTDMNTRFVLFATATPSLTAKCSPREPRWVLANSWNFTETEISDPSEGTRPMGIGLEWWMGCRTPKSRDVKSHQLFYFSVNGRLGEVFLQIPDTPEAQLRYGTGEFHTST